MTRLCFLSAFLLLANQTLANQQPPNILHILVDDMGWNEVEYHQPKGIDEVKTPNIDSLRQNGLELDRFYTHKICSPSRSSIQSGRDPVHVNVQNVHPEVVNSDDELGGFQGMPLNMTTMAQVLKSTGQYETR